MALSFVVRCENEKECFAVDEIARDLGFKSSRFSITETLLTIEVPTLNDMTALRAIYKGLGYQTKRNID